MHDFWEVLLAVLQELCVPDIEVKVPESRAYTKAFKPPLTRPCKFF